MSWRSCSPFSWIVPDELLLLVVERARDPFGEHLAVTDDRRQRRPELVAHRREEVRLQTVELLQPIVRFLELAFFSVQLAEALPSRSQMHLLVRSVLWPAEENQIERGLQVLRDARDRLGLGARHLQEEALGLGGVDARVDLEQRRRRVGDVSAGR